MQTSRLQNFFQNRVVRSFIAYSIFRAFYGAGILAVAYFVSTSAEAPWPVTVGIFLCSMVLSRLLFKRIKGRKNMNPDSDTTNEL